MSGFLDYLYHTKMYQSSTKAGPYKVPEGADKMGEKILEKARDATAFVADLMSDDKRVKGAIKNLHIPTERNYTRALNGILQGIIFAIVAIALTNFGGKLAATGIGLVWSAAGVRHIIAADYNDTQKAEYTRNRLFFWQ